MAAIWFGCRGEEPAIQSAPRSAHERVISLAPNITEIIVYSGFETRLVATDDFSNHPESVKRLPKVGGIEPNLEKIAHLQPDLVLASASASHPQLARGLASLGVRLTIIRTDRLAGIADAIARISEVLGDGDPKRHSERFKSELERSRRTRERPPRVLFVVWADPLYVAGRQTYMDDLIQLCGGRSAIPPSISGWPQYSLEAVIAEQPDVLLIPDKSMSRESFRKLVERDPRWRAVRAVTSESYFEVDEDLFTRPGPRIVLAAEKLNAILDAWESNAR